MDFFTYAPNSTSENKRIEIRPGRTIHCRRVFIRKANQSRKEPSSGASVSNVLFVHGSCAASSQYDDLIREMEKAIQDQDPKKTEEFKTKSLNCYLYDQLGCSESKHPIDDWLAFSTEELNLDLQVIISSILNNNGNQEENRSPLFIVGHSHGCSQIIQVINNMNLQSQSSISRIKGVILIGGLLSGSGGLAKDGGHWIFTFLPMFMLHKFQPFFSEQFFQAAVHPSNKERLRMKASEISNRNDMRFCKAFYRQQKFATAIEASTLEVSDLNNEIT